MHDHPLIKLTLQCPTLHGSGSGEARSRLTPQASSCNSVLRMRGTPKGRIVRCLSVSPSTRQHARKILWGCRAWQRKGISIIPYNSLIGTLAE